VKNATAVSSERLRAVVLPEIELLNRLAALGRLGSPGALRAIHRRCQEVTGLLTELSLSAAPAERRALTDRAERAWTDLQDELAVLASRELDRSPD